MNNMILSAVLITILCGSCVDFKQHKRYHGYTHADNRALYDDLRKLTVCNFPDHYDSEDNPGAGYKESQDVAECSDCDQIIDT